MVEVKDAFESYGCLVFVVRSKKSGSTGAVLQRSFARGCQFCQKLDRQWFMNFYRTMVAEFGFGPNTKIFLTDISNYRKIFKGFRCTKVF